MADRKISYGKTDKLVINYMIFVIIYNLSIRIPFKLLLLQ
jgi:hypothetical protein